MQAYNSDLVKALQALHGMSCKRLGELTAECNHEEDLAECCVPLPAQIRCLSEDDVVSIDTIPLDEEPEALEAEHGLTVGQEGMKKLYQELTLMMVMQLHYKNNQADYPMYLQKESILRQNLCLNSHKLI
jgi:hypothetical protein